MLAWLAIVSLALLVVALYFAHRSWTLKSYETQVQQRMPGLPKSEETSERLAVLDHISRDDVVLEIGANQGGVTSVLARVVKDPKQIVSVDPHKGNCAELAKQNVHVFCGVIEGPSRLECTGPSELGSYVKCEPHENPPTTLNRTVKDLQAHYGLTFTAAVIDCEGCYEAWLPQILDQASIRQVQIEWDGQFLESDLLKAGFFRVQTYVHPSIRNGVRVYKR